MYWKALIEKYPEMTSCQNEWEGAMELLRAAFRQGSLLMVCGNGGSAADSEHIGAEMMKGYRQSRPIPSILREALEKTAGPEAGCELADQLQGALPAISLVSQMSLITACANDIAPDLVFAQQVYGYGRPGDVLLALSTSGNSLNILRALQVARSLKMRTIGFTGRTGGVMVGHCDVALCVPADNTADIQEMHQSLYHSICAQLEVDFF
jgi:D-sedoheptulose 7-phosphate isomerase